MMFEHIVNSTNDYIVNKRNTRNKEERSVYSDTYGIETVDKITIEEIKVFLGISLCMSLNRNTEIIGILPYKYRLFEKR